jgi:hypothetical protein
MLIDEVMPTLVDAHAPLLERLILEAAARGVSLAESAAIMAATPPALRNAWCFLRRLGAWDSGAVSTVGGH